MGRLADALARVRHRHHRHRLGDADSDEGARSRGDAREPDAAAVPDRHRRAARRRAERRRDRAGVPLQHRRSAGDRARQPDEARRARSARRSRSSTTRCERFAQWQRARGAIPTVVALRQRFENIRRAELQRLEPKLAGLPPEARGRVDEITRLIVEKLLLQPTEQLKTVPDSRTMEAYSDALSRLFALERPMADAPSGRASARRGTRRPAARHASGGQPRDRCARDAASHGHPRQPARALAGPHRRGADQQHARVRANW